MASGELSLTSNSSQEFNCYSNERSSATGDSTKNYDSMKQQYDQACTELNALRLQQGEGEKQMKRVMEQLEYYREQYLAAMNQIGQSTLEGSNLRSKYVDINKENIRLQQRIHHLEKKTRHEIESNGNNSTVCTFVEQYNELKKKYDSNRIECDKLAKEMEACKKICSDLSRDRNSLALEKDELKQQLSTTFAQLEAALRDKNIYRESREKMSLQHDGNVKELTQVVQQRTEELRRMTSQYKAVDLELRTILSEREGVLEENQKLSDDLAAAKDELDKIYKEDKSLAYENESLKREMDTLIRHRDDVLNERNALREEIELLKTRDGNVSWKELNDAKNKFTMSEHCLADLEAANKEIEKLRKNLDRAKFDIDKSLQEIEVAKSRRDWAISEREKIVQERDSVKSLCDGLRKERDTAVSDLLAAIRDSEQIKKQKDEAMREVEQLREQIDAQMHSSRDMRWRYLPFEPLSSDTELIELDLSPVAPAEDIGIMFDNREDPQSRCEHGMAIVGVAKDSPAHGKLSSGDFIMRVNNLDCTNVPKRIALDAIRNSGEQCSLLVRRPRVTKSHMYIAQLNTSGGNLNHGLSLETGIFISKILPNSLAAKDAELAPGDRILSINNKTMEGVSSGKEAMAYLNDPRVDVINVIALKQLTQPKENDAQNQPLRLMHISTQTDERLMCENESTRNTHSSGNAKSSSKISEMFNKFRGKIHMHAHQKGSTASESDSLCQENDAIAVLDSVLNNENSSPAGKIKENIFKRSKKAKKEATKEANKHLGTWPRANIMNMATSQENHTGTIVQHRKKERPALSLFTGPISLGGDEKLSQPPMPPTTGKDSYFAAHANDMNPKASGSNRNSNPIPFHVLYPPPPSVLNRHSVYSAIESDAVMHDSSKSIPSKSNDKYYHHHHHHHYGGVPNNNRLSLNITPSSLADGSMMYQATTMSRKTPPVTNALDFVVLKNSTDSLLNSKSPMSSLDFKPNSMQQQQDLISLKSQNSIDSFLSPKSQAPSIDMSTNKTLFPRDNAADFYAAKRAAKSNAAKFPSDSDSLGMESISSANNSFTSTLPSYASNSRFSQAMITPSNARFQRMFPPFPNHMQPTHSHHLRQTSPLTVATTMTQSLDTGTNNSSSDKLDFDYVQPMHSHGASMDVDHYNRKVHPIRDRDVVYGGYGHVYEGGTFPRKKENQRVRIPSNPSVASKGSDVKNSTGSIEHCSEHGSPMPPAYKVEVLSHGGTNKRGSKPDYSPSPGDLRRVTIDKSAEPLGITIQCNNNGGGIFVSTVTENSIASQVGLQIGDQLLEVCGINMRDATHKIAAKILRQCGNAITMLVQYCPEKYDGNLVQQTTEDDSGSRSGSPTPRNSPRGVNRSLPMSSALSPNANNVPSSQAISKRSLLSSNIKKPKFSESLDNQSECSHAVDCYDEEEPRVLTMHPKKSTNLGISLMGGNAVGIFVHDVQKNSIADLAGLKKGDQILEYNGVDLRCVTAETAATEISKPAESVTVLAQYNMTKFNQIKDEAGDSLYIRAGFDRTGDLMEGELQFSKDDVLYVDTTIFRGKFGQWRAWKLDEYGHRLKCGIIPSQLKIEEELRYLSDATDGDSASKRTLARRSFFRRKKHQRSSSRDSKDLSSLSSTQLSWFSDSGILGEDGTVHSYQRVERLDYSICRPVLILGPLADCVADKLTIDFPQLFRRCETTTMNCTEEAMEKGLHSNIFIDYRRRGSIYECTTVQAIRELGDKNRHCLLDVSISAVERLKRIQIYPIVLLLRFKSAKQIKEIKDSRYCNDKTNAKAAKEMYEHALKLESDFRQYISAVIPAGVNITHMSTQIKAAVDEEQNKVLWIPMSKS